MLVRVLLSVLLPCVRRDGEEGKGSGEGRKGGEREREREREEDETRQDDKIILLSGLRPITREMNIQAVSILIESLMHVKFGF